jgi:hypothetical protein
MSSMLLHRMVADPAGADAAATEFAHLVDAAGSAIRASPS